MTDEEVKNLLPWYVNNTLSDQEREEVTQLLSRSAQAREEESFLRQLASQVQTEQVEPVSELAWRRLQRDMRADNSRDETTSAGRNWWKPGIAAAATVMLALQISIIMEQPVTDTDTRLLSQDLPALQDNYWLLQLEFRDDSQWQQVAELISQIDGRVVDGPSSVGLIRVAVPGNSEQFASVEQLLAWLQQQPVIDHAAIEGE